MQAPIGNACSEELACAVTRSGALGSMALTWDEPDTVNEICTRLNESLSGLWAANFVMAFPCPGLPAAIEAGVPIITLSWGMPKRSVDLVKRSNSLLGIQIGSVGGALSAARMGADFLICQGIEAGGHVQSSTPLRRLLEEVLALKTGLPLVAAGGIGDATDVRRVLDAGADIAALGTRFVAANESRAHPDYQQALLRAAATDTAFTCCFDGFWPHSNSRVLRNSTLVHWEAEGCPPPGKRPDEGEPIACTPSGDDVLRYNVLSPVNTTSGSVLEMALYAGTSCERIESILPAEEIIRQLAADIGNQAVA